MALSLSLALSATLRIVWRRAEEADLSIWLMVDRWMRFSQADGGYETKALRGLLKCLRFFRTIWCASDFFADDMLETSRGNKRWVHGSD